MYSPRRTSEEDRGYPVSNTSSRRKQSQDTTAGYHRRQQSAGGASDTTSTANGISTTAASGMVIPTKSTITEEVIEVPYGRDRDGRGSTSTINDDMDEDLSGRSPMGGLSGLSARLRQDDDDDVLVNGGGRKNSDYFDRSSYGRASATSERSPSGNGYKQGGGRNSASGNISATEDQERLKKDYEFKIATMQNQITSLQRDLGAAGEAQDSLMKSEDRVTQLEEELSDLRRVCHRVLMLSGHSYPIHSAPKSRVRL